MAQNEMRAKPALPERVRSMEGLGVIPLPAREHDLIHVFVLLSTNLALLSVFDASRVKGEVTVDVHKTAIAVGLENRVVTAKGRRNFAPSRAAKKNLCVLAKELRYLHVLCDSQRVRDAVGSGARFQPDERKVVCFVPAVPTQECG